MQKKILIGIFISLILFSCGKHKQETPDPCNTTGPILPIDEQMQGFFFKPESFWVYKNDSLNLIDSVVLYNSISSCEEIPDYGPPHGNHTVRYYCLYYIEYPSGKKYFDAIESDKMYRNFFPLHYYWWSNWFLYAVGMSDTAYIDSIQVGSHTFYKCLKSRSIGELNPVGVLVYVAKDYGIIKKIITGNPSQEWYLIRWKIIK